MADQGRSVNYSVDKKRSASRAQRQASAASDYEGGRYGSTSRERVRRPSVVDDPFQGSVAIDNTGQRVVSLLLTLMWTAFCVTLLASALTAARVGCEGWSGSDDDILDTWECHAQGAAAGLYGISVMLALLAVASAARSLSRPTILSLLVSLAFFSAGFGLQAFPGAKKGCSGHLGEALDDDETQDLFCYGYSVGASFYLLSALFFLWGAGCVHYRVREEWVGVPLFIGVGFRSLGFVGQEMADAREFCHLHNQISNAQDATPDDDYYGIIGIPEDLVDDALDHTNTLCRGFASGAGAAALSGLLGLATACAVYTLSPAYLGEENYVRRKREAAVWSGWFSVFAFLTASITIEAATLAEVACTEHTDDLAYIAIHNGANEDWDRVCDGTTTAAVLGGIGVFFCFVAVGISIYKPESVEWRFWNLFVTWGFLAAAVCGVASGFTDEFCRADLADDDLVSGQRHALNTYCEGYMAVSISSGLGSIINFVGALLLGYALAKGIKAPAAGLMTRIREESVGIDPDPLIQ